MLIWLKSFYCSSRVASMVIITHNGLLLKKIPACLLQVLNLGKGPDVPCDIQLKEMLCTSNTPLYSPTSSHAFTGLFWFSLDLYQYTFVYLGHQ